MGFEVGDKVRILDGTKQGRWNPEGFMKETIGMVGKITDIDRHDPKYRVTFEDDDWWDYNEEDLEKVEDLRELIKPSYAVRIRDGRWLIAFRRKDGDINLNRIDDISCGVTKVSDFDENLLDSDSVSIYDIMEIRGYKNVNQTNIAGREVIWERIEKSPTQIRLEELETVQRRIADEIAELRKELEWNLIGKNFYQTIK